MKRMCTGLLAAVCCLMFLAGCGSSGYEGPPEGWEVRLVRNVGFLMPEGWTKEDVGYGGSYYYPPDGGMLMVMPASWGMSDLSSEEGAEVAFDYLLSAMDRNLPGFALTGRQSMEQAGRPALRVDFTADGSQGSTLAGVVVMVASAKESEVYQFAFVLDGPADGELATSMEEIIASIGAAGTGAASGADASDASEG